MAFGNRNSNNIIDYSSGYVFYAEVDKNGVAVTASTSAYEILGYTQGSKLTHEVEEFSEIDDSGKVVVRRGSPKSFYAEGTFLERDESIRQIPTASYNKFFRVVYLGAAIDVGGSTPKYELWIIPCAQFDTAFSYEIGGKARMGYKLTGYPITSELSNVPLPVSLSGSGWTPSTATVTKIEAGKLYYTADIT